jgi:uncharacterized protein (DUF1501 family)
MLTSRNTKRRDFLKGFAWGLSATATAPLLLHAAATAKEPTSPPKSTPAISHTAHKRLIIFDLSGGNDGLNTLVPYRDPLYRKYRPTLALKSEELITLTDDLALNSTLKGLADIHQQGEVAIIQDVGFPNSPLSHFACADYWDTAGTKTQGWIANAINANREKINTAAYDAHGIVLGRGQMMLTGQNIEAFSVQGPQMLSNDQNQELIERYASNPSADYIASVFNNSITIQKKIQQKLKKANRFERWFDYGDPFGTQISSLLWLIENGVQAPVFKISLGTFDHHDALRGNHEKMLSQVDRGLKVLKQGLTEMGGWNDTLILMASEFGRRPAENASAGTDHGTVGPLFLVGGKVSGGLYGQRADLAKLDQNGNPTFTTDFRRVYASIISNFWGFTQNPMAEAGHTPLEVKLT